MIWEVKSIWFKGWVLKSDWRGVRGWIRRHVFRLHPERALGLKMTINEVELPTISLIYYPDSGLTIVPAERLFITERARILIRPVPEDADLIPGEMCLEIVELEPTPRGSDLSIV